MDPPRACPAISIWCRGYTMQQTCPVAGFCRCVAHLNRTSFRPPSRNPGKGNTGQKGGERNATFLDLRLRGDDVLLSVFGRTNRPAFGPHYIMKLLQPSTDCSSLS